MTAPNATYLLDSYRFHWPAEGIEMLADRLHDERDGLKCELRVSTSLPPNPGLLREGRFNLSSPTTRTSWVRALEERLPGGIDWYAVMETVCALSIRRWRDGESIIDLGACEPDENYEPYLMDPYLIDNAPTVLFADGGSGKSLLALAWALSVATAEPITGAAPTRCGPVLYLDWEWGREEHSVRLNAMCRGYGIERPRDLLFYRRETARLVEGAASLRRRVAELGITFVVIDSLGFARGGDPEKADVTLELFAAIRSLGVPTLCVDHVPKNTQDKSHSFGSVYTYNSARKMWRIDSVRDEGAKRISMALVNTKANMGMDPQRGLHMDFVTDDWRRLTSVRFTPCDPLEVPGAINAQGRRQQIVSVLRANGGQPMATKDIASCLEAEGIRLTEPNIRAIVNQNPATFVRLYSGKTMSIAIKDNVYGDNAQL